MRRKLSIKLGIRGRWRAKVIGKMVETDDEFRQENEGQLNFLGQTMTVWIYAYARTTPRRCEIYLCKRIKVRRASVERARVSRIVAERGNRQKTEQTRFNHLFPPRPMLCLVDVSTRFAPACRAALTPLPCISFEVLSTFHLAVLVSNFHGPPPYRALFR